MNKYSERVQLELMKDDPSPFLPLDYGRASGKTTFAKKMLSQHPDESVVFYKYRQDYRGLASAYPLDVLPTGVLRGCRFKYIIFDEILCSPQLLEQLQREMRIADTSLIFLGG